MRENDGKAQFSVLAIYHCIEDFEELLMEIGNRKREWKN